MESLSLTQAELHGTANKGNGGGMQRASIYFSFPCVWKEGEEGEKNQEAADPL